MPKYPIKLGKKMSESMPMVAGPMDHDKDMTHYPSLYLEWDSDYELPESGTMTVKFRKVSETNSKNKEGQRQTVSLDIEEILDTKADKKEVDEESGEAALDRLKKESEKSEDDEDYSEEE